jgi:hypothetical protein
MRLESKLISWGAASAPVLLVCMLLAPSPANASCGDYVQRGKKSANPEMNENSDKVSGHGIPGGPKLPCSGPRCSQGSEAPLIPVSLPLPIPDQWALSLLTFSLPDEMPIPISGVVESTHRIRNSFSIYHPPRA